MNEVACPSCSKALPESVLKGPAQAVVRCEGCSTLLLWSHGKVVRSARSNPQTLQGVPVVKQPPAAPPATPPAATAKPAAKTLMGIAKPPVPKPVEEQLLLDESDIVADKPPPPVPAKVDPPRTSTLGRIAPIKRDALVPNKPAAKPAEPKPAPAAAKTVTLEAPKNLDKADSKPHIAAAIAQAPSPISGPMEDPKEWFDDTRVSDHGDDEPTSVGPAPTAPDPLPPLEPQTTNLTEAPVSSGLFKREISPKPAAKKPEAKKADPTPAPESKPTYAPENKSSLFTLSTEPEPLAVQKTAIVAAPATTAPTITAPAPVLPKKKEEPKPEPVVAKPAPAKPKRDPFKEKRDPSPLPLPLPPSPKQLPTPSAMHPVMADRKRPPMAIIAALGGGALLLVGILFFALRSKPAIVETTPPTPKVVVEEKPKPVVVEEKPQPPPVVPVAKPPEPPPEEKLPPPTEPVRVAHEDQPTEEPATPRRHSRNARTPSVPSEPTHTAPEPKDDSAAIERAKEAYKRGNEKLFAGNSAAAVAAYKESLTIFPGYAAGYRGLGLAYAQSGNNAEAVKALKTYVKSAPNAHDVSLIKQRIEHLEKSPQD